MFMFVYTIPCLANKKFQSRWVFEFHLASIFTDGHSASQKLTKMAASCCPVAGFF